MARGFAEETTVPISKTREEIARLLQEWGAGGIGWADDFDMGRVVLHFRWMHTATGQVFVARFHMQLRTDEQLKKLATVNYRFGQERFDKLRANRGKAEHRRLLLWLKGAFNAVEAGLVLPEQIFLPWLVTSTGATVYEAAREMPEFGGLKLPEPPGRKALPPGPKGS